MILQLVSVHLVAFSYGSRLENKSGLTAYNAINIGKKSIMINLYSNLILQMKVYFDILENASSAALFISSSERSFMWVAIFHWWPKGSSNRP